MGVDTNSFNPDGCNQNIRKKYNINGPLLLFVGRLSEKKGIKYLIQAIPKILVNFPKTKLLIVGKGEEESELKKTMNHLSLSENIIFTGAIENKELPAYYIAADIFIGPSIITKDGDREGFGLVFAEALSSNCVTISTDLPSISDIIINNKTGFTVKQKNPDEISNKVIEILKNNNKKIIIAGRKHIVDNFDWKIIAQKYSNLVKRID